MRIFCYLPFFIAPACRPNPPPLPGTDTHLLLMTMLRRCHIVNVYAFFIIQKRLMTLLNKIFVACMRKAIPILSLSWYISALINYLFREIFSHRMFCFLRFRS